MTARNTNSGPLSEKPGSVDFGPIPLPPVDDGGRAVQFRRLRSARRAQPNPEAWHPRRRDILGRLVRGTEAPTDTLPVIVNPERTQLSEY